MDALLPIVGLIIGAALNEVHAWLRHRRETVAARQAKDFDYQEQNLYHLQEALSQLGYLSSVFNERRDNADDRLRFTETMTWSLVYMARASEKRIQSVAEACIESAQAFRDALRTDSVADAHGDLLSKVAAANVAIGAELKQLRSQAPRR